MALVWRAAAAFFHWCRSCLSICRLMANHAHRHGTSAAVIRGSPRSEDLERPDQACVKTMAKPRHSFALL
jgi:hypothetical protein